MKYLPILTLLVLVFSIFFKALTYSGDFEGYSGVSADVKASLCGDFVVEGDEKCEPLVPVTQNCTDLGYDKGSLTCDSSCSYITTNCEYIPPKPILPPFPNIYDDGENQPDVIISFLPFFLEIYDLNSDGKLTTTEYCVGLEYWLKKWKLRLISEQPEGDIARIAGAMDTCDLNFDKNCDLVDFSIFLHNAE